MEEELLIKIDHLGQDPIHVIRIILTSSGIDILTYIEMVRVIKIIPTIIRIIILLAEKILSLPGGDTFKETDMPETIKIEDVLTGIAQTMETK